MDIKNLLTALASNYKLEPYTIALAKEMIDKAYISDNDRLLKCILKSQKYDFLSKLDDAIKECDKPTSKDDEDIYNFCKKIVDKCRVIDNTISASKPEGFNYQKFSETATYDMFINPDTKKSIFSEKEIKLLDAVGGCYRWLNEYDNHEFFISLVNMVKMLKKESKQQLIQNYNNTNKNALQMIKRGLNG